MTDDLAVRRRLAYARMALAAETMEQLIEIRWVVVTSWPAFRKVAGADHHALGFAPPVQMGGRFVVYACAEVLASVADHLDEEGFFAWVAGVRTHLHLHITQMEMELPPDLEEVGVLASQREIVDVDFDLYQQVADQAKEAQ